MKFLDLFAGIGGFRLGMERAVRTYEERQLALISQDKAIRQELADLKRYIQTGEASGG
ncbi:DNA cytosine methyltransferase [Streptococcus sp. 20-1249]|uniref:DNA cytosine methyltransferase n=1 Tax=Streptococcus hepaticus TaxID=3349163 RepID=UPI00374A47B9